MEKVTKIINKLENYLKLIIKLEEPNHEIKELGDLLIYNILILKEILNIENLELKNKIFLDLELEFIDLIVLIENKLKELNLII